MSEYQYYEFQAIDRPLSEADRRTLRGLSTRARITATSFTNSYEWGDFKGNAAELMARWFDLHLHLANWGSRRLMIKWPTRLVDRRILNAFIGKVDCAKLLVAGKNLILDVVFDDVESGDWDDGSGRLAALAPLRTEVLEGDLRLFYLLWLTGVEADVFEPDDPEPMPGIGPMTGTLEALADFFDIDRDLVAAAAERPADLMTARLASHETVQTVIAVMPDQDKTSLLARLFDGDAHVRSDLRALVRQRMAPHAKAPLLGTRKVSELRARATAIRLTRERAQAEQAATEREDREAAAERARRVRLEAIARRGESVWREIDAEIECRNASSYDRAAGLLLDLKVIAKEKGASENFDRRLQKIRDRHARKERFIERLAKLV